MWSIGVVAYMLLSSFKPFYHKDRRKMVDRIMLAHFTLVGPIWDAVSESAKDFVSHLLVVDPGKRMDAEMALRHEWIVKRKKLPNETIPEHILLSVDDSLLRYRQTSELKKLALMIIAHQSTTDEILQLRKVFGELDTECNGVITFEEFKHGLSTMRFSDDVVEEIFASVDMEHKGSINYTEFIAATIEAQGHIAEERIAAAFDRLDADGTGYISKQNIRDLIGEHSSQKHIDAVMEASDSDKDGKISYPEFLKAFRAQTYDTAIASFPLTKEKSTLSIDDKDLVA